MKANGARTQRNDPFFSLKGAENNFLSSTNWCVSPLKETDPDLPRNGSALITPLPETPVPSVEILDSEFSFNFEAHEMAPLLKLGAGKSLDVVLKPGIGYTTGGNKQVIL